LLSTPGIDLHKKAKDGRTPLLKALSKGLSECARLIRETETRAAASEKKQIAGAGDKTVPRESESQAAAPIVEPQAVEPAAQPLQKLPTTPAEPFSRGETIPPEPETGAEAPTGQKQAAEQSSEKKDPPAETPAAVSPVAELAAPSTECGRGEKAKKPKAGKGGRKGGSRKMWLKIAGGVMGCLLLGAWLVSAYTIGPMWALKRDYSLLLRSYLVLPGIDEEKLLFKAVCDNRPGCVKTLVDASGIDVNKGDKNGRTALHVAADWGRAECVRELLQAPGIDVNKGDKNGETALHEAAYNGYAECVRKLLQAQGIDVNKADKYGGTALQEAAFMGHAECVRELLKARGIDVNMQSQNGKTALNWAAAYGRAECVRELLKARGIDVNKADQYGDTALQEAASNGHEECVRELLQARE